MKVSMSEVLGEHCYMQSLCQWTEIRRQPRGSGYYSFMLSVAWKLCPFLSTQG